VLIEDIRAGKRGMNLERVGATLANIGRTRLLWGPSERCFNQIVVGRKVSWIANLNILEEATGGAEDVITLGPEGLALSALEPGGAGPEAVAFPEVG